MKKLMTMIYFHLNLKVIKKLNYQIHLNYPLELVLVMLGMRF